MRGRDQQLHSHKANTLISIHAPRAGARPSIRGSHAEERTFQSTRPVRGRDAKSTLNVPIGINFNPRAPCGGATGCHVSVLCSSQISIHAPRAGARLGQQLKTLGTEIFQSTRPVRGRDFAKQNYTMLDNLFQSTRPVRGRDHLPGDLLRRKKNFNPRAPCGGATVGHGDQAGRKSISIHAPRAGARPGRQDTAVHFLAFQSTRPVRGRDGFSCVPQPSSVDFNPRAPCGGATNIPIWLLFKMKISIHAPRAGARPR